MKASLLIRQRPEPGERYAITSEAVVLGRNEDSDVVLDSTRVSRYHARIAQTDAEYRIEDLASKNGTWLNGTRLEKAAALKHGDVIRIGDISLVFEIPGLETDAMTESGGGLPDGLTRREAEVLALIGRGLSSQEIATTLVLSVRTIERHISNLYAKIGAKNRAEATTYAIGRGIR